MWQCTRFLHDCRHRNVQIGLGNNPFPRVMGRTGIWIKTQNKPNDRRERLSCHPEKEIWIERESTCVRAQEWTRNKAKESERQTEQAREKKPLSKSEPERATEPSSPWLYLSSRLRRLGRVCKGVFGLIHWHLIQRRFERNPNVKGKRTFVPRI